MQVKYRSRLDTAMLLLMEQHSEGCFNRSGADSTMLEHILNDFAAAMIVAIGDWELGGEVWKDGCEQKFFGDDGKLGRDNEVG